MYHVIIIEDDPMVPTAQFWRVPWRFRQLLLFLVSWDRLRMVLR